MNKNSYRYLRVSLLPECNLRCFYCRPHDVEKKKPRPHISADRFASAIKLLYQTGVRKVRFTGGEPTLYKDLPELITRTKALDDNMFAAMTSNGRLLRKFAPILADAGLDSINISLDTLEPAKFRIITSVDALDEVLAGIDAAIRYIPATKLNCVLIKGINDDEVSSLIDFADRLKVDIRFIEYMPTRHHQTDQRGYLSNEILRSRLPYSFYPENTGSASAARYYRSPELKIRVGFISPISRPFCSSCNRIRLASDGMLYGCLFSADGISLFDLIENDPDAARREIDNLVAAKQNLGCTPASHDQVCLPSFYFMGG